MNSQKELAATVRAALKKRRFTRNDLAHHLCLTEIMVDKLLSGEVVPSQHLEKEMIEKLQIPETRVRRVTAKRVQST